MWQVQDSNLRRNAPSDLQTDDRTALTSTDAVSDQTSPRIRHRPSAILDDSRTGSGHHICRLTNRGRKSSAWTVGAAAPAAATNAKAPQAISGL
jgi:hypothetical protein